MKVKFLIKCAALPDSAVHNAIKSSLPVSRENHSAIFECVARTHPIA